MGVLCREEKVSKGREGGGVSSINLPAHEGARRTHGLDEEGAWRPVRFDSEEERMDCILDQERAG